MENSTIFKEIRSLLGIKLKDEILLDWISELQNLPNFDSTNTKKILMAIIDFISRKDVDLGAISEKEECPLSLINSNSHVLIFSYHFLMKIFKRFGKLIKQGFFKL